MRTMCSLLAAVAVILLTSRADAQSDQQSFVVSTSGGPVLVERLGRCARPTCPAVLVLSGSKGFAAPAYGAMGQALQAAGLDTYLVHVLSPADLTNIAASHGAQARIAFYARRMSDWTAAVRGLVADLRTQSGHSEKIGILGISLGAEIASIASVGQVGIGALVLVDGGLPAGQAQPIHPWPPLLLIWGGADRTFSLSVGQDLQRSAQRLGGSATLKVYEGGAHDFFVRAGNQATVLAHQEAADFLAAKLLR